MNDLKEQLHQGREQKMALRELYIKLFLLFIISASGCTSIHVKPPTDYSSLETQKKNVLRVAFDQDGNIYPEDSSLVDWSNQESFYCNFYSCPFKLNQLERSSHLVYDRDMDNRLTERFAKKLNSTLSDKKKLIIFIHGFNNDFKDANGNYDSFFEKIKTDDAVRLDVFWDGLAARNVLNSMQMTRWFKAMTYSNLAGQIGLRRILNRLDKPVDIVFVTHSRGAAVALSSVVDPVYDSYINAPGGSIPKHEYSDYEVFNFGKVNSLTFALVAPAIGNGHFHPDFRAYLPVDMSVNLIIGYNSKDFAISKLIFPESSYGDTSLGSDSGYIKELIIAYEDIENLRIAKVDFTDPNRWLPDSHSLDSYLCNPKFDDFISEAGLKTKNTPTPTQSQTKEC